MVSGSGMAASFIHLTQSLPSSWARITPSAVSLASSQVRMSLPSRCDQWFFGRALLVYEQIITGECTYIPSLTSHFLHHNVVPAQAMPGELKHFVRLRGQTLFVESIDVLTKTDPRQRIGGLIRVVLAIEETEVGTGGELPAQAGDGCDDIVDKEARKCRKSVAARHGGRHV